MASVRSLGIHKPSALPFLVDEGILPSDPAHDAFKWRTFSQKTANGEEVGEELLITDHCVVWSRAGIIQQVYRFDVEREVIIDAVFTNFLLSSQSSFSKENARVLPSRVSHLGSDELKVQKTRRHGPENRSGPSKPVPAQTSEKSCGSNDRDETFSRALVVVLKTQAHICFLGQNSHVVRIPFEVEAVFASFPGILLQRKIVEQTLPQPTPVMPAAPHNTFSYSQPSTSNTFDKSSTCDSQPGSEDFNNKFLPFLEKLKSSASHQKESQLPRLFSLVDPLTQLSPVIDTARGVRTSRSASHLQGVRRDSHLDPDERLLYASSENEMTYSQDFARSENPLAIALTINEKQNVTSLWAMTFVGEESRTDGLDPLSSHNGHVSRRRSSFNSRLSTGATTPVPGSFRHASLQEKGEDVESQPLDSLFEQTSGPAKSSRRISSLLARSDLSMEQDKATFNDLVAGSQGTRKSRRGPSFGIRSFDTGHERSEKDLSTNPLGMHDGRSSLEAVRMQGLPFSRGADDLDFPRDPGRLASGTNGQGAGGIRGDVMFQKVYTLASHESGVILPPDPARQIDIHVFTLQAPGPNLTNFAPGNIFVCAMNRSAGELTIFQVRISRKTALKGTSYGNRLPRGTDYELKVSGTRRSGVLDACKLCHGLYQWILVLDGKANTLTIQAPWSQLLKIDLPSPLNLNNPFDITIPSPVDDVRGSGGKRTIVQSLKGVNALKQGPCQGRVGLIDQQKQHHCLAIQLKPSVRFVHQAIKVCQAVLPLSESNAETILRGWWDVMIWLAGQHRDHADDEVTALFVLILCMAPIVNDGNKSITPTRQRRRKGGLLRSSSGANTDLDSWDEMFQQQSGIAHASPEWMTKTGAWGWVHTHPPTSLDQDPQKRESRLSEITSSIPTPKTTNCMTNYIELARDFARSAPGQAAIGNTGYLPVATSKDSISRKTALPSILVALHLYREELKLDVTSELALHTLTPLLAQLGTWLDWPDWSCRQGSYFMLESTDVARCVFEETTTSNLGVPQPFPPPSILRHVESINTKRNDLPKFPDLLEIVGTPTTEFGNAQERVDAILMDLTPRTMIVTSLLHQIHKLSRPAQVSLMAASQLTFGMLETLPESVAAPLRAALATCRSQPQNKYKEGVLDWVDREDIMLLEEETYENHLKASKQNHPPSLEHVNRDVHHICAQALEVDNVGPYDGSAEVDRQNVTRLLFGEDQRFAEAANLVHPLSYPVARCIPEPGWSESDLLEAQQELAKIVAMRTLSVSLGRGVLFYGARLPMLTEKYPIHGFTLSCTMKPSDTTVTADKAIFTEDKVSWAFFHAGVESGLSISRHATGIDTSWILFNKPKELTNRHAGFLLALGLNGHLKEIAKWVAFKYLTPKHNMTSVGFLLGVSASYLGTMDTLITRLLSVHVTRMLPAGAAELNLSPLTQTCGIMGIGLVYCNTQHRRMSEILLSELEYMGVDDGANPMENLRDEGYRLAAGLALGLINLGNGRDLKGLQDMRIAERLLNLAVATKEVDQVHVADGTTAGAIIAIALIFMKTNDEALARKIDIPDTAHQFEYVRPDHLLLRTVTKCLILWDAIKADERWVQTQLPAAYRKMDMSHIHVLSSEDLPLYNTVAGLCFAIGLRFAGSGDENVRDLLCTYLDYMMRLCRLPATNYDAKLASITIRNCQDLIALCAAAVMAGTGNLVVLRKLRSLHGRTDGDTTYGSHLAAHFAIGLLFLAGGTHTLGTSNLAIASLLCSFYPLFPATVLDNKSHLQAFRHFWVFAVEPRCVVLRNIDNNRPLSIPIETIDTKGRSSKFQAPCLLPELSTIAQIRISDPDYWPVTLDFVANPKHLSSFRRHQSIFLRQRNAYDVTDSSVFNATMKTLNDKQTAYQLRKAPFEWLLDLNTFQDFDHAERALLLPSDGGEMNSSLSKMIRTSVIDDRLVLETSCLGSGRSEKLWNLRLLLRWAEECERKGEDLGWLRPEMIERLRAKLVLWSKR